MTAPSEAADRFVVGVDFGTLSGRALVVRVSDGKEVGAAVHEYTHGVLEDRLPGATSPLPPEWALQVPEDYRDVLRVAVPAAIASAGIDPSSVVGVATDFTSCTMVPTLADGTPMSELPKYAGRPHAYVKLWKHHAAQDQADRINRLAKDRNEAWLPRYGGLISAEWEFAKGLQLFEEDRELFNAMDRWVEAADWITWQLCGRYIRNACSAGYKGIWQEGRYPSAEFLEALGPGFSSFVTDKLHPPGLEIGQLGGLAGTLTPEAASWTGLPAGIAVAVGNVDAHVTASAAQAIDAGQMVAIIGTSTCHVMSADVLRNVPGICGVVDGGIIEGSWGYEAGQSGVGDIFAWMVRSSVPENYVEAAHAVGESVHEHLTRLASGQLVGEHGLVALDWHSGNRSILVDHELSGAMVGLGLGTKPEDVYRALLEATAFGTRIIIETFRESGLPVRELVVAGGLIKNALLMQIYADVTRLSLSVIDSDHGPGLGSAIHAAVASGDYPDVRAAAKVMGRVRRQEYVPDEARAAAYDRLFDEYVALHDFFGRNNGTMRRLKTIRHDALRAKEEQMTAAEDVADTITALRHEVCTLHAELTRYQLVVWTAGNVSARVPGHDLLVIKPSGVPYDELTPENMVVCDLGGKVVEGDHAPSSDTEAQAYVYREMPHVGGVVHTHSTYATAWAARGEPIPCGLTMCADEFGGEIPVGPFAIIGDDSIGRGIVTTLREHRSPAVLMCNHGVFTIGRTARAAVKAAVMCEDVARTVHIAKQLGEPLPIERRDVDTLFDRYQNSYGQR